MEKWFATENVAYVETLEKKLTSVLNRPSNRRVTSEAQNILHSFSTEDEVYIFPHFFGELAKTAEGCKLLKKSNAISKFLKCIKSPKCSMIEKRAAVWALVRTQNYHLRLFQANHMRLHRVTSPPRRTD